MCLFHWNVKYVITEQLIDMLTLHFTPAVSLSSSLDATFPEAFPEEKEEGGTFGKNL